MKGKKQIFKILNRVAITLFSLILILSLGSYFIQRWLEYNIEDLINANEKRAYNISYEKLDLNPFLKGFKLDNVNITPLNKIEGTIITCKVDKIVINGLSWSALIINRQANIAEITFVSPDFKLSIAKSDTTKQYPSRQIQEFFGDILSRVKVNRFKLAEGSFIALDAENKDAEIGHIGRVNIDAKKIETDSVQWKHFIPFKINEFSTSFEDIVFHKDEHTIISLQSIKYLPKESSLILNKIALKHNEKWYNIAHSIGKQTDIFEVDVHSLVINGITTNTITNGTFNIHSESLIIDRLQLKDQKDKNLPIGERKEKPMFSQMVASIPFELNVDSIFIKNSSVAYTEISEGKQEAGTILLNRLNGSILGFSTIDSLQKKNTDFTLKMNGRLNNEGKLHVNLTVPYDRDVFGLNVKLTDYNMKKLNTTIKPMLGIVVESGELLKLDFYMNANKVQADNKMIMQYKDLKLTVLNKEHAANKKRGMASMFANSMIRAHNLPDKKQYIEAEYSSTRDVYKAPFNFIWFSVQNGLVDIVPSKMAKELMHNNDKKSTKKSKKKRER